MLVGSSPARQTPTNSITKAFVRLRAAGEHTSKTCGTRSAAHRGAEVGGGGRAGGPCTCPRAPPRAAQRARTARCGEGWRCCGDWGHRRRCSHGAGAAAPWARSSKATARAQKIEAETACERERGGGPLGIHTGRVSAAGRVAAAHIGWDPAEGRGARAGRHAHAAAQSEGAAEPARAGGGSSSKGRAARVRARARRESLGRAKPWGRRPCRNYPRRRAAHAHGGVSAAAAARA